MYPKGQVNLRSSEQNERTVGKREEARERRRKEEEQEPREDKEAGWHLSGALEKVKMRMRTGC